MNINSTYEEQLNHKMGEVIRITVELDTEDWGSYLVLQNFNQRKLAQQYLAEVETRNAQGVTFEGSISGGFGRWLEQNHYVLDLKEEEMWLGTSEKLNTIDKESND